MTFLSFKLSQDDGFRHRPPKVPISLHTLLLSFELECKERLVVNVEFVMVGYPMAAIRLMKDHELDAF